MELEHKQRQAGAQIGKIIAARAELPAFSCARELHAFSGNEGIDAPDPRAAAEIDSPCGSSGIVAMKTASGADIKLAVVPRTEDQIELGADYSISASAG